MIDGSLVRARFGVYKMRSNPDFHFDLVMLNALLFCFDYVIMRLVGQFNMHYKLCLTSIKILIVYKDEMVVRLSHLYNGNSCIGKMIFSY